MLQECLKHDQVTVIKCLIKQQLDNRKFIHEPMTIVLNKTLAQAVKKALSRP